ncbi:hypothetical protein B0H67DRAFT_495570 [Lasiosphaeris hirsuta]|uniref:Uncharacterized protein n=1 Tax=Lasiosphaeris hirsuta TaxID=260670 RepID=A0AA40DNV8_9PEZI|nr:hypothetical protein B0H67DRAFT_495570 [Lasiosphaeris hirsuta]
MFQVGSNQSPVVLGVQANFKYASHRRHFTPFGGYCKLLRDTASEVAVVYDSRQKRGWLVPKLSLLLHMSHAYALRCADGPADRVPFVDGHTDAGELIPFLEPLGDRPILGSDANGNAEEKGDDVGEPAAAESVMLFRQLLLGLNTNLLSTVASTQPSGRRQFRGFEFMDVVTTPGRGTCMKSVDLSSSGRVWLDMVNAADAVVVCSDIGEVITPMTSGNHRPSTLCNSVPLDLGYLSATVPCLARLAHRRGEELLLSPATAITNLATTPKRNSYGASSRSPQGGIKVSENGVWSLHGNPFGACQHKDGSGKTCWERTDLLQRVLPESSMPASLAKVMGVRRQQPGRRNLVQAFPEAGAVVFGGRK